MRRLMSSACFTLGIVWEAAAVGKLLFGVQMTLFVLPPLGLERVRVGPAIVTGLAFCLVGALLGRAGLETRDGDDCTRDAEPELLGRESIDAAAGARPRPESQWRKR